MLRIAKLTIRKRRYLNPSHLALVRSLFSLARMPGYLESNRNSQIRGVALTLEELKGEGRQIIAVKSKYDSPKLRVLWHHK
jgi:hypothetical protein